MAFHHHHGFPEGFPDLQINAKLKAVLDKDFRSLDDFRRHRANAAKHDRNGSNASRGRGISGSSPPTGRNGDSWRPRANGNSAGPPKPPPAADSSQSAEAARVKA